MKKMILVLAVMLTVGGITFADDSIVGCAVTEGLIAGAGVGKFTGSAEAGAAAFIAGAVYGALDAAVDGKCDTKVFGNSDNDASAIIDAYTDPNNTSGWDY